MARVCSVWIKAAADVPNRLQTTNQSPVHGRFGRGGGKRAEIKSSLSKTTSQDKAKRIRGRMYISIVCNLTRDSRAWGGLAMHRRRRSM